MIGLGIIGEYLGKMILILNRTPQYIVRETINITEDEKIADFNDQMGILPMVGQRIEALQAERAAAEAAAEDQAAKEAAEKEAAEKAETEKEAKEEVSRVRRRGSVNLGFFDKVR